MLKLGEAHARIDSLREPNWFERHAAAFGPAADRLRSCLRAGSADYPSESSGAVFRLSTLSDSDRRNLFTQLFPALADSFEHAWKGEAQLPAPQPPFDRRPFRTPFDTNRINARRDALFVDLLVTLQGLNPDPAWLAAWCPYLEARGAGSCHRLLAGALDAGGPDGEAVFQILCESASGSHGIGHMGEHVVRAFTCSHRSDGWDFLARLLVAAQRQEGLRQSILELAPWGRVAAFRRLIALAVEERLARFASTIRAIDFWFGFRWDSASTQLGHSILERTARLLDDESQRSAALRGKHWETAFLALWCDAFEDAEAAVRRASELLQDAQPHRRWLAAHALSSIHLPSAVAPLVRTLDDPDIRVAAEGVRGLSGKLAAGESRGAESTASPGPDQAAERNAAFESLESLLGRIHGKVQRFRPLVFPWGPQSLAADQVGAVLVEACTPALAPRLIANLSRLSPSSRSWVAHLFGSAYGRFSHFPGQPGPTSSVGLQTLITMLADPVESVRSAAAGFLDTQPLSPPEAAQHERLLDRAAKDVRARAIRRLATLPDDALVATIDRLLQRTSAASLGGAIELLQVLRAPGRAPDRAAPLIRRVQSHPRATSKPMLAAVKSLIGPAQSPRLEDAFGLVPILHRRPIPAPRPLALQVYSPADVECVWLLNDLIETNKSMVVQPIVEPDDESPDRESRVLGSLEYTLAFEPNSVRSIQRDRGLCPLRGLVEHWYSTEPTRSISPDTLTRAWTLFAQVQLRWTAPRTRWPVVVTELAPPGREGSPRYYSPARLLLEWLLRFSDADRTGYFLDQYEAAIAHRPRGMARHLPTDERAGPLPAWKWDRWLELCPINWPWQSSLEVVRRREALTRAANSMPSEWQRAQDRDEDGAPVPKLIAVSLEDRLLLWSAGDISDDEIVMHLVNPERNTPELDDAALDDLRRLTGLRKSAKPSRWERLRFDPRLDELVERVRKRVLEIELARSDAPTIATPHAKVLDPSGGTDVVVPALAGLGKARLKRFRPYFDSHGLAESFSLLIQASRPGPSDSFDHFRAAARAAALSDQRLIELAIYQPRWAAHVEHALGWPGLADAVLWIRAHTRGASLDRDEDEAPEAWESRVAELTPISRDSLADGAVDRKWFERCHAALGRKRWQALYDAAKYACSGAGHTRAQLFADAILGAVKEKDLLKRIAARRHQDSVRALGLAPIAPGDRGRRQILARYRLIQDFRRTSRRHGGAMLQASERRAVEIGLENLAWSAGYPDPLRLQWAMEATELGDLADGPIIVRLGHTSVSLSIDDEGVPSLAADKAGRALKSVPPAAKKDKRVAELAQRLVDLRRQRSRIRESLEQAMCRADEFRGDELSDLFRHPLLRAALARLVLVASTRSGASLLGYPAQGGRVLQGLRGAAEPLRASDTLRIAHPLDLLRSASWHDWQADCFRAERVQPFKQVFRELYTVLPSEAAGGPDGPHTISRYQGQQIHPRQGLALFNARAWVARPEEGVQRTFHRERISVRLLFEEGFYSPAEIDGLTLAGLGFYTPDTAQPIPIADVPPRIFSEVLRDLDLVVSVAHRGGVDPEASQSTIEMRTSILRETCALLSLSNVRIEGPRALIAGARSSYAVHLGSGTIHLVPGGALWVVPVHSQHQGRIFLPFADGDPKSAEIISKVLLLSRDDQIQDPAILAQILQNS